MSGSESTQIVNNPNCDSCNSKFGFFVKKVVCYGCKKVFCTSCAKNKFKIASQTSKIRLCDPCFDTFSSRIVKSREEDELLEQLQEEENQLQLALDISQREAENDTAKLISSSNAPSRLNTVVESTYHEQQIRKEENELQEAIALSLREWSSTKKYPTDVQNVHPIQTDVSCKTDPTLAMYLNRKYWEDKRSENENKPEVANAGGFLCVEPANELDDMGNCETTKFCQVAKEQTHALELRIQSNLLRFGSIEKDNGICTLASRLINCHGHVMSLQTSLESDREFFAGLQKGLVYIGECKKLLAGLRSGYARGKEEYLKKAKEVSQVRMQQMFGDARKRIHSQFSMADKKSGISSMPTQIEEAEPVKEVFLYVPVRIEEVKSVGEVSLHVSEAQEPLNEKPTDTEKVSIQQQLKNLRLKFEQLSPTKMASSQQNEEEYLPLYLK